MLSDSVIFSLIVSISRHLDLFPLDRAGRLRGEVVEDAVDARDFRGDAGDDLPEKFIRNRFDGCGHRVDSVDRTDDVVLGEMSYLFQHSGFFTQRQNTDKS